MTVTNGSRLVVQGSTLTGIDGSKIYQSWGSLFDTKLNVQCSPTNTTSDGTYRCLPYGPGVFYQSSPLVLNLYSDSTCSTPVVPFQSCYGALSFVNVFGQSQTGPTCGGGTQYVTGIWALSPYSGPVYLKPSPTTCQSFTASAGYTYYFARLMAESEFVSMTWTTQ
jgi:hypothetical protein